jgi:3-methyl-2-oxobutanoate hydroxymethyltransferase
VAAGVRGRESDTQFLFSDDLLGDYDERPPRHAKAYRRGGGVRDKWGPVSLGRANFAAEHRRLQQERLAAFCEYIADVNDGRFPERGHLVELEAPLLDEVVRLIGGTDSIHQI